MSKSTWFTVIVKDELQCSFWPTHYMLPLGWRFTDLTGTQAEMEELLQQFVETTPGAHIAPDMPLSFSQWENTASDVVVMPSDDLADSDLLAL